MLEIHSAGTPARRVTAQVTVKGGGTATVVSMTEKFTVAGYRATIVVTTWMANGVGPVQSQAMVTELGHSQLLSQLKLKSFTHG